MSYGFYIHLETYNYLFAIMTTRAVFLIDIEILSRASVASHTPPYPRLRSLQNSAPFRGSFYPH